ncbi:DUF5106 domain-containing protein [Phocaeicola vulgatus]|nr:DUF5106 domain-containing protein [Phocaeicola vulgatus]
MQSCQQNATTKDCQQKVLDISSSILHDFKYPHIPSIIVAPKDRINYLLLHYWDCMDLSGYGLESNMSVIENGFINYISLIKKNSIDEDVIYSSFKNLNARLLEYDSAIKMYSLAEKYLYLPDNPYSDEKLYTIFLKSFIDINSTIPELTDEALFNYNLIRQNSPGCKANDLNLLSYSGKEYYLNRLEVETDYILLILYDPDCTGCRKLFEIMTNSYKLNYLIGQHEVTVIAICVGSNIDIWKKNQKNIPYKWKSFFSKSDIIANSLYDIRALPSLYLLTKERNVILKDTSFDIIIQQF